MARAAKKQKLAWEGDVLTITYPGLKKSFAVDISEYSEEIREEAMYHGFKQKFGDAASGKSAAEKYDEVKAIHRSLLDGEWERTASPDLRPIVAEAIARLQNKPLEKVRAAVDAADEDTFKQWSSNGKVKSEILKIRAERLDAEADESDEIEIEIE